MRVLAIESSGRDTSIAALEGGQGHAQRVQEHVVAGQQRTAQVLAPALKELLAAARWPVESVGLVVVTVGPGSFTGLRIGVTTAKTLAYAVGAEVIGVNTLSVLAEQAAAADRPLWTVMDAQRQELFAAKFGGSQRCGRSPDQATLGAGSGDPRTTRAGSGDPRTTSPLFSPQVPATPTSAGRYEGNVPFVHVIPVDHWLANLRPGDLVTGPALAKLQSRLPAGVEITDPSLWHPTATTVGQLAWRAYEAGHRDDLWHLTPQYYRPSAAEEKRAHD